MVQKNIERKTTKRTVFFKFSYSNLLTHSYVETRDAIIEVFILSCTCTAVVTGPLLHNKNPFTRNFSSFLTRNSTWLSSQNNLTVI